MKKIFVFSCFLILYSFSATLVAAQDKKVFHGAQARLKHYRAVYMLNSGDDKKITATLRNMKNALEDPRLAGKLELELVVFGDGVAVFNLKNNYEATLKFLQSKGVILAQCENTLKERQISKSELFDFISFVPSGNGELIIRQQEGWAIIHP